MTSTMPTALDSSTHRSASCRCGRLGVGRPAATFADGGHAVAVQLQGRADHDGPDQHDQSAGHPGDPLEGEQQPQGGHAHRQGGPTGVPEVDQQVAELADGVAFTLFQAEELGELADGDEDGQPEHEPLHHRAGQELGDEA
jgi:hypothetical protein